MSINRKIFVLSLTTGAITRIFATLSNATEVELSPAVATPTQASLDAALSAARLSEIAFKVGVANEAQAGGLVVYLDSVIAETVVSVTAVQGANKVFLPVLEEQFVDPTKAVESAIASLSAARLSAS